MSSVKTYALQAADGHLFASFSALTLEEGQQRARVVAKALGLTTKWNLIELADKPGSVPWFEEDFFATLAQAFNKLN